MAQVKLHGFWSSPYSYRVIWALRLKGIPYEYVEEDLSRKSPLLLQYNPIHKKIPVLVHGDKPICESTVILEYLDETWPHNPFMPTDPMRELKPGFGLNLWKRSETLWMIDKTSGEEQDKIVKESLEILKTMEEKALGEKKFFGGDNINIVDIICSEIDHWLGVVVEVGAVQLLEPDKFSRLHAWTKSFKEAPFIKDNFPDRDKLLAVFKHRRDMILASLKM